MERKEPKLPDVRSIAWLDVTRCEHDSDREKSIGEKEHIERGDDDNGAENETPG